MRREVYFEDIEIRKRGKKYYMRKKIYKRGFSGFLTIRTHTNGKGRKLASIKIKDFKHPYEVNQAIEKLCKRFGIFQIVTLTDAREYFDN